MKTYQIILLQEEQESVVSNVLKDLAGKGMIQFSETDSPTTTNPLKDVSEAQTQEIIEESEIGPYYTEQEAKDILHL